ncbi:copper-binding protein [Hydrogenophaga sp. BPS33]|uniref:copper-binding protein n=1 Tax=Hydrogenophaga sp. BPS33 TaxID=2651974 RepID=UPI00131FB161|nr:copper-binding protein [Hydrogenophaga sp. BPS33]QHE89143.1 copper-binding protein [Hydrogenophaga sp. BPS33]
MKKLNLSLAASVAALSFALAGPALAQMTMDNNKMGMTAAPGMTDGEIRKIDKENGKITIKHGEIKHMDMPPMTMVFTVKDKAVLDKVKVGEKVQFIVIKDAGKMVVTDIQPGK